VNQISVVPIWTNISRRFFLRSYFCVVVEALLQPQCRRDLLLIFACISENSTDPIFTVRFVSCLLCCCWVSLQPQFRRFCCDSFLVCVCLLRKFDRFWRQKSSFRFVLGAVLLLSSTPATVTFVFRTLRSLCVSVLCCCWVPLQPQLCLRLRLRQL
jgi:hypothetical protein